MKTFDETLHDWFKDYFKPLLDKHGIRHTGKEIDALKRYIKEDLNNTLKEFKNVFNPFVECAIGDMGKFNESLKRSKQIFKEVIRLYFKGVI